MSNRVDKELRNPLNFSFPTIFEGKVVFVTVYVKKGYYGVLIDDDRFAQIKFRNDFHNWFVAKGELNDLALVKEIGERIAAKLN
ncbi:MAG TPA: hypothetical protein VGN20_09155 [Mucilaginibacter sp.]|jgi:hypothetical protein